MSESDAANVNEFDVVVIGGGVAGLAGALCLARARRSVLVVDAGHPRNAPAAHTHGYLTRDGANPLDLVKIGRPEVLAYGAHIVDAEVTSARRLPDGSFRVEVSDGTAHRARRLLAATSLVDELPDVPGLRERWGNDVVHCPYCFGWELNDQALGVLATSPTSVAQALQWRQWSATVTFLHHTGPELTDEQREQLAALGIPVVEGEVEAVEAANDRVTGVRLKSGAVVPLEAVVVRPWFASRHELLDELGATAVQHPQGVGLQVQSDEDGLAAPGVWVAGNDRDVIAGIMQSAASGVHAAEKINADLTAEDTAYAVAAHRGR
jgi:thioredoxin reductase (NADPH)